MPTPIWGEPASLTEAAYPLPLLKHLLQQMMIQFAADGACLTLFDENIGQMVIRLHVRLRGTNPAIPTPPVSPYSGATFDSRNLHDPRITTPLGDPSSSAPGQFNRHSQPLSDLQDISPEQSDLFPVGTAYRIGHDLVGAVWRENKVFSMHHDDYLTYFYPGHKAPLQTDIIPTWYLAAPIAEPPLLYEIQSRNELHGKKRQPHMLGVVVLYQTRGTGFQQKPRLDPLPFTERIALYLQNDHLQRLHERTNDYMQWLQQVSATFASSVKLADLLMDAYRVAALVVDVSSMLITIYDRDTRKIYDVFAVRDGEEDPVPGLPPAPVEPADRPVWWRITQEEKKPLLLLSPASQQSGEIEMYDELLQGVWGDQHQAESFLLLPMKMFTRVIGSLSITSHIPNAYTREVIPVLQTMVQIITVSIENAKLYNSARKSLNETRRRESELAAMNSALQAISSVLNVNEVIHKFVESAAQLVQAEMCAFFLLSPNKEELIAQAIYEPKKQNPGVPFMGTLPAQAIYEQNAELPLAGTSHVLPLVQATSEKEHRELIEKIRLPFKGTVLERMVNEGAFFYLDPPLIEELAPISEEGGAIFLQETNIQKMLMIPVQYQVKQKAQYQTKLIGILALHTPGQSRVFLPKEIGVLLAVSAPAATALRNAQLFEETQEAYARLEYMSKLKDEFIVTASHELRTPLSAISGYASMLKRQGARVTPAQVQRFVSKISDSAQQLSALVSNMTEAANIGNLDKEIDLHTGPVRLIDAAVMAVNMLSINSAQKITPQIPPDLWVSCDPLRLRQVLTNLLDNAVKYSPEESSIEIVASTTTLSQVPLPEELVDHAALIEYEHDIPVALVRVYDEGEGILPEDREKIFEKFVRAPRSLTTTVRGTGLGLYICHRYIEAMGGKLWLEESTPGQGSVFTFYLPQVNPPIENGEKPTSPPVVEGG